MGSGGAAVLGSNFEEMEMDETLVLILACTPDASFDEYEPLNER